MIAALRERADLFASWQVLHQAGEGSAFLDALDAAYADAGVHARVVPFLERMDLAWASCDAVVTRAGAGAVAEAWATGTPALFLPYPFHADDHQRVNASPLIEASCALLVEDLVRAERTLPAFARALERLLDADTREAMRHAYTTLGPADGAQRVAQRVLRVVSGGT